MTRGYRGRRSKWRLDGKLIHYLVSRTPVRDFPRLKRAWTGGSGTVGARTCVGDGVQVVFAGDSAAELHRRLLAMAKEQSKDVYEAETVVSGDLTPRMLYKVHPDGTRQLVRGRGVRRTG